MKMTGWRRVKTCRCNKAPRRCESCGGKGEFHVTFADSYSKLVVVLCAQCAEKRYEDLRLQSRFDWPLK